MQEPAYPRMYLYRRIAQAKLYIDAGYARKLDLDNIADEAAFSKYHFIRLFARAYGYTPHRYLSRVRIGSAREMLARGCSVTETCFAVGFDSLSSFTTLFKRMQGLSPSAYRQQQLGLRKARAEQPLGFVPNCFAGANGWLS